MKNYELKMMCECLPGHHCMAPMTPVDMRMFDHITPCIAGIINANSKTTVRMAWREIRLAVCFA